MWGMDNCGHIPHLNLPVYMTALGLCLCITVVGICLEAFGCLMHILPPACATDFKFALACVSVTVGMPVVTVLDPCAL